MAITTCQKVTLISCSVLCVSLFLPRMFLPRRKKETGPPEGPTVGPGFYPPRMHQVSLHGNKEQWMLDGPYSKMQGAEVTVKVKGIGGGKKYNLMAQVIPIYGFGIFLYIFYIIYKLTCKGKAAPAGNSSTAAKDHTESKISAPDYELATLQEKLLHTERMMERIASGKSQCSGSGRRRKNKSSISKKEEKLLKQLRQITLLMQDGRLEGASPEMEAEQVPYGADWEGYPEETYPIYDETNERPRFHTIMWEEPPLQPTAEALAERMEQEEEEMMARKLSIVQEEDEEEGEEEREEEEEEQAEEVEEGTEEEEEEAEAETRHLLHRIEASVERKWERIGLEVSDELRSHSGGKKQISFSDHRDVFHYPKEDTYEDEKEEEVEDEDEGTEAEEEEDGTEMEEVDEEDPVMEAESLLFSSECSSNPEEEAERDEEEYFLSSAPVENEGDIISNIPKEGRSSGLRMRNRRERKTKKD